MTLVTLKSGKTFESVQGESILDAATRANIILPYSCKTGRCSMCKCKMLEGETKALVTEWGLSEKEKADGWILSCARTAITDLFIETEDLQSIALFEAKTLPCRISHLEKLAPDVLKVILRLPPRATLNFIPGQYIVVIGPGGVRRSYSLANAPKKENTLELHIRAVEQGVMSQYWFERSALNDLLRIYGPQGTFFLRNVAKRDLIFLATGTGFAPVKAMLEALPSLGPDQRPASITVVWGARQTQDFYFDVPSLPGIHKYIPVLSKGDVTWQGERGHVQEVLLRHFSDLDNAIVYACGSASMIQSAKSMLVAAGLPNRYFYSDAFVCSNTLTQ